jgi:hypothetical protein
MITFCQVYNWDEATAQQAEIERLRSNYAELEGYHRKRILSCQNLEEENERLRAALKPFADLAVAIDGNPSCVDRKRSDNSTIWQGNAMQRGPWDITMGHARAARAALEA